MNGPDCLRRPNIDPTVRRSGCHAGGVKAVLALVGSAGGESNRRGSHFQRRCRHARGRHRGVAQNCGAGVESRGIDVP